MQTVDDDQLWCACMFDLHEATFHEAVDLTDSAFERDAYFYGTKFERVADFHGADFTVVVADFRGARFTGVAYFVGARFTGVAGFTVVTDFGWAEFRGGAAFSGIQGQPSFGFEKCKFNREFRGADAYTWGRFQFRRTTTDCPQARCGRISRRRTTRTAARRPGSPRHPVYGSHMGFIWESYANRPAWSVGLFDPESDAAYAQAGGAGARPGGVFRKRRFPGRSPDQGRRSATLRRETSHNPSRNQRSETQCH